MSIRLPRILPIVHARYYRKIIGKASEAPASQFNVRSRGLINLTVPQNKSTIDPVKEMTRAVMIAQTGSHRSRKIIALVILDIKDAFNLLKWASVLNTLEHCFHILSYLTNMILDYLSP